MSETTPSPSQRDFFFQSADAFVAAFFVLVGELSRRHAKRVLGPDDQALFLLSLGTLGATITAVSLLVLHEPTFVAGGLGFLVLAILNLDDLRP